MGDKEEESPVKLARVPSTQLPAGLFCGLKDLRGWDRYGERFSSSILPQMNQAERAAATVAQVHKSTWLKGSGD